MRKNIALLLLLLTAALTTLPLPADVVFDETNFPDANFRSYLKSNFSSKGFTAEGIIITTANLNSITSISCSSKSIASLKGIEHFTALKTLECFSNQLTELDVTQNTALTGLSCGENQLTDLDVSQNTTLTWLYCGSNQLTELDVSGCTALTQLDCCRNQLTEITVAGADALTEFDCSNNQLTELDMSQNTALTYLYCSDNQLTVMDVSGCTALTYLSCVDNQLTALNVTQNNALTELWCYRNQLTALDVTQNAALTFLWCSENPLTELDVTQNTALTELRCYCNQLAELDVSKNRALETLYCYSNPQLIALDVTQNTALTTLVCDYNPLTELDVTKNTALTYLSCYGNQLTELDVTQNTALTRLNCEYNQLRALDLSKQTQLAYLHCSNQRCSDEVLILTNTSLGLHYPETVDPSRVSDMKVFGAAITYNNTNINGTNYHHISSGLTFHEIKDILWNPQKITYNYDVNCPSFPNMRMDVTITIVPYVACGEDNRGGGNFPDVNFRASVQDAAYDKDSDCRLSKQELTELLTLDVSNKGIENMQGIEYMRYLQTLDCSGNQLTGIDVSYNTKLQTLNCSNNRIAGTLNLSADKSDLVELHCGNNELTSLTLPYTETSLVKLTCNDNQLWTLSVNNYTAMTLLDCSSNLLTSLTVTRNSKLETLNCSNNKLREVKLPSSKTVLLDLNCRNNQLTYLSAKGYTAMNNLNCGVNKLTELDLDGNTKLETLDCASQIDRSLKRLTLPHTTTLTKVYCNDNSLTELDLSNNTELFELDCSTNNLTALDLSANTGFSAVEAGYLDYSNQTRSITAESAHTPVTQGEQTIIDKFYYLRLDNQVSGAFEKSIWGRMTETNYGRTASTFLPERVVEWVSGGQIIEGTRGKSNAAGVGDVNPNMVYGDILFLTDVTESDGVASGTVTYTYNVNNPIDPDGNKGNFTLNWTASAAPDVVTEVTDLGAMQREPVAVEYHNLAGMSSDRPWQGLNIVVTRYSDGTTETSKVLK